MLLAAVTTAAVISAQAPAPQPDAPKPLWTLSTNLAQPESAYYHPQSNSIFVSNINGQILDKDGNGYITRIAPGGKVIGDPYVAGLNAPKGIRSIGRTLWVADIDEVVSLEIGNTGRVTSRVRVDGASFLNDLATAPDGTIYVSDSNQSRIYMVRDGKSSVFVEGADVVEVPNGVLVDGGRLIVGTVGPVAASGAARGAGAGRGGATASGKLLAFDLKTKQRTQLTAESIGGIDGIESAGSGGYFVTDVIGRRLLHVAGDGKVTTLATFAQGGADFGYQPKMEQLVQAGTVYVPFLAGNSVAAFDLYPLLRPSSR